MNYFISYWNVSPLRCVMAKDPLKAATVTPPKMVFAGTGNLFKGRDILFITGCELQRSTYFVWTKSRARNVTKYCISLAKYHKYDPQTKLSPTF